MRRFFQRVQRVWFDLPLSSKGMIVISVPLVSILVSVAAIHTLQVERAHVTKWIFHAFQAGTRIQMVARTIVDAESDARGFLITGNPGFLQPVLQAQHDLPQRIQLLREWVMDSPTQLSRLERIERLAVERMTALNASLAEKDPSARARHLDAGRTISLALDSEFNAMREEETRLWNVRIAAETAIRRRLTAVTYGSAILAVLAGSLAMALFVTGIVRRSHLLRQNAGRLADGLDLAQVGASNDEIGQLAQALSSASRLLASRETELRSLNQDLDVRVKERTAQLELETTERLHFEEQLLQSQKMEAIGRLAGGVAHDFNNILTVLFGFSESLREKLPADSPAQEDLDEIRRASEHAASLTRQLLAFSRRQTIAPKVVDLNEIVTRTSGLLRRLIGEDIYLEMLTASGLPPICADEGQIEQVILNLAVNARDAMPAGGKLTFRTEAVDLDDAYCQQHLESVPGRYAMLAVADTGHGMAPEIRAHLFEPFFTTKGHGKGTGLGLSMVYGIVKQNGGNIWVYSEPGLGATFKIYFPAANSVADLNLYAPVTAFPQVQPLSTILLVEDEPSVREMAYRVLIRGGFVVLEADCPETARRLYRDHAGTVDLLLTDIIMPKTNGRQLARELCESAPTLKVLYMSGYIDDVINEHNAAEAPSPFLEKPFTPRTLLEKVHGVLASAASAG